MEKQPQCLRWMKENPGFIEGFLDGFVFFPLTVMTWMRDKYYHITHEEGNEHIAGLIGIVVGMFAFVGGIAGFWFLGMLP